MAIHLRARVRLVTTSASEGASLHAEVDGRGPRLVLVHGFGQNRRCWGPIAADLRTDHEVVRVDAPGRPAMAGPQTSRQVWAPAPR
jgi:2-succinyl-6-hydroxy-2,4-cyclohexadiene-1-carboxylate synthase